MNWDIHNLGDIDYHFGHEADGIGSTIRMGQFILVESIEKWLIECQPISTLRNVIGSPWED